VINIVILTSRDDVVIIIIVTILKSANEPTKYQDAFGP